MGLRFNVGDFLKTAAQVGAADYAGRIAGEQELQKRQEQQAMMAYRQAEAKRQEAGVKQEGDRNFLSLLQLAEKGGADPSSLFAAGAQRFGIGGQPQPGMAPSAPALPGASSAMPAMPSQPAPVTPQQVVGAPSATPFIAGPTPQMGITPPAGAQAANMFKALMGPGGAPAVGAGPVAPPVGAPGMGAPPVAAVAAGPTTMPAGVPTDYGTITFPPKVDPKEPAALRKRIEDIQKEKQNWPPAGTPEEARLERDLDAELSLPLDSKENITRVNNALLQYSQYARSKGVQRGRLDETQTEQTVKGVKARLDDLPNLTPEQLLTELPALSTAIKSLPPGRVTQKLAAYDKDIQEALKAEAAGDHDRAVKIASSIQSGFGSNLKPAEVTKRFREAVRTADPNNPRQPFEALGIGHIYDTMTQGGAKFIGGEAEKEWQQTLKIVNAPAFAKETPASQHLTLQELDRLSKITGRDYKIPDVMLTQLTPDERQKFAQNQERIDIAKGNLGLRSATLSLQTWKAKQVKSGAQARAAGLTFNAASAGYRNEMTDAAKRYNGALRGLKLNDATFDPEQPLPADASPAKKRLQVLYKDYKAKNDKYINFITDNDPSKLDRLQNVMPPPPVVRQPAAVQRVVPRTTAPVAQPAAQSGKPSFQQMTPEQQQVRRRELIQNVKRFRPDASQAEINQVLRSHGYVR